MHNLRVLTLAVISFVLAFVAGPAAAQNVKYFKLGVALSGTTVTATFTNVDNGNSSFNAVSLKAKTTGNTVTFSTTGVTVDPTGPGSPPVPSLAESDTKLIVTDLNPVKKGKSVIVTATVNLPALVGQCVAIEWIGSAWTGSVSSPSTVFQQQNANPVTYLGTGCKLAFTSLPSSLTRNGTSVQPFAVEVTAQDSSNNTLGTFTGNVTLAYSGGCSGTSSTVAAVAGVATFSGLTPTVPSSSSSCSIQASAPGLASTGIAELKVFDGVLACTSGVFDALNLPADVGTAGSFDASAGDAAIPGDTGFIAGVRGTDPLKGVCVSDDEPVKVNYEVVNNILTGGSPQTDPLGNTVYVGSYSVTWDSNQTDGSGNLLNPVFAVIVTLRGEWGDATTGLPTRKTLVCTATPCETTPYTSSGAINTGWKVAPACLSTLVQHSSLPYTDATETTRERACLASERWDVVATSECSGSPPSGAVPPEGRCLKPTSILIMGDDPVFGR